MKYLAAVDIQKAFFGSGQVTSTTNFQTLNSVSGVVSLFLKIAFVLAGLILLFFFILGGWGLIGSAGKNDPKTAEQAKATITSAVIGFIVVFVSYWIVKLIGTLIGQPNII